MKRHLAAVALITVILCLVTCSVYADSMLYIQGRTSDKVHLRLSPDASSASLGLYFTGTPVKYLMELDNGWTQVQVGSEIGYVMSSLLARVPTNMAAPVYEVYGGSNGWVNLRAGADYDAEVLMHVTNGTRVYILGETVTNWYYVDTGDGFGYMFNRFLREYEGGSNRPVSAQVQFLGMASSDGYICSYVADNGQTLYFTTEDPEPIIHYEDINFDGRDDLLIRVIDGASNAWYEVFVWNGREYVHANRSGRSYHIGHYELYPERRIMRSRFTDGYAGALGEVSLYRWDGAELILVRRMKSEMLQTYEYAGEVSVSTTHGDILHIRIWDYAIGTYDGTLLWEKTVSLDDYYFDEVEAALWQGL